MSNKKVYRAMLHGWLYYMGDNKFSSSVVQAKGYEDLDELIAELEKYDRPMDITIIENSDGRVKLKRMAMILWRRNIDSEKK